jgi:hypothetical protein
MRDENMTPDETVDDGADDLMIRRIARELKEPVAFGSDFDARVLAAVRGAAADDAVERQVISANDRTARGGSAARRAWGWVVRPRTLRVSPLAGLAAAAALAFVMVGVSRGPLPLGGRQVAGLEQPGDTGTDAGVSMVPVADTGTQPPQAQLVQFVLVAPSARSVALVGDFNDWNAERTPLEPVRRGGVWTVTVPLPPGKYTYNFVVDGTQVMPDPAAPKAPTDDFGTPASIVTVAGVQS